MKTRLFIIIILIAFALGSVGTAFATHDPNQPRTHSIVLPPDMIKKTFDEFMEWCEPHYGERKCNELYEKNLPQHNDYTEEILIVLENKVKKVYYAGENIISVVSDPKTASVIFETGKNAKLDVKAPRVYEVGPGLFTLRNGEEVVSVHYTTECFFYASLETQEAETIEIIFPYWPENPETVENCETFAVAPLKQVKLGVPIDEIECRDGFVMVIKNSNDTPACVKSESIPKLVERTWAKPPPSVFRDGS